MPQSSNIDDTLMRRGMSNLSLSSSKTMSTHSSFQRSSFHITIPAESFSLSMVEESIRNAESIISKWGFDSPSINKVTSLFHCHNREEAKVFLQTVKGLRQSMHLLLSEHSASHKLVTAQNLMQVAMKRLEKELYQILSAYRDQLDPESVSGRLSGGSSNGSSSFEGEDEIVFEEESKISGNRNTKSEKFKGVALSDLKAIVDCMISCGYGEECVKIYKVVRKSVLDEGLYLLEIEQFRSSKIQKKNWEDLECMINNWVHAVNIALKTLFNAEKILSDHVFSASQRIRECCFFEITKEGAMNLLKFPELVAKSKKLPERIFPLMELYEALFDHMPDIELIFSSESTLSVKLQAHSSLVRLGESVRSILSEFESTIHKDSSKTPVRGGGIHPLTRTVMSYISSLADYSTVLSNILTDSPSQCRTQLPESYFDSPTSEDNDLTPAVSLHLAWLILVLLCKVDKKSEIYKDVSLSYLFLVNNLHFIVNKVCSTRLKVLLGQDWVIKHANKVKQYALNYETHAWNKVISTLPVRTSEELSVEVAKSCFQRFNAAFEEAYRKQTSWIVGDRKLRDDLKVSIEKKIVTAYREFYDIYLVKMSGARNLEGLVRICPDDLENYLSDLFHGDSFSSTGSTCPSPR
ncbi:hypothetical protein K2173_010011 [Erythroxylum novogranatense]|uniref:Exocyst subunit Exo70 family protein n=1 Tax=Erythroxylum novogranatense TaxID=1862640 RepID=A0AAV8SZL8_9ROSI|nr:hypothetical protein K2173_010011 [Erythroxylum novogranatense]